MPFLLANDSIEILVPAGQKICVTSYGAGTAKIETATEPGNYPVAFSLLTSITNSDYTSSAFTRDTTVKITAGLCEAEYVIGVSPVATKDRFQPAAVAITGGSINGTTVGQATPSSGSFTNLIASENVGIGVTPSAWRSSEKAIDIAGGAAIAGVANEARIYANAFVDATPAFRYKATGAASLYSQSGGGHLWNVAPSGTAGNTITFTQAMTLDASGNLGLGVTPSNAYTPGKVLQIVSGGVTLYGSSTTTSLSNNTNIDVSGNILYQLTQAASRYQQDGGTHKWYTAPSGTAGNAITFTQAMTLDARGNLGLGYAPSDWGTGRYRGFQLLSSSVAADNGTDADFGFNFYRDSVGAYRYSGTGGNATARTIRMDGAGFKFFSAPTGPEGSPITFTQAMALTNNGNLLVGGQADSGNRACFSYETNGGAAGLKLTSANRDTSDDNVSAIEIIGNSTYGRIFNIQCDGQIEILPLGIARFKINNNGIVFDTQPTPDAVNATATLTTTNLSKKIITSTTAAAVTATLPTGTLMDGAFGAVSDLAFNWTVINTGPNAFTLAVGTGHTIVGNDAVATNTSGTFRSRRTGAATWVSYRIS